MENNKMDLIVTKDEREGGISFFNISLYQRIVNEREKQNLYVDREKSKEFINKIKRYFE